MFAKRICDHEPRAVCTHCYGHALNLAAGDTLKQSKLMKEALETTREITKLIEYSPRRLKETLPVGSTPGIRSSCRVYPQHPCQLQYSAENLGGSAPSNERCGGQGKDPRGGSSDDDIHLFNAW